jgi:hypothetical protein
MDIVTGAARQRAALLKTTAGFQQANLISVDIGSRMGLLPETGVAPGAEIQAGWPDDLLMPFRVTVAFGALYPQRKAVRVSRPGRSRFQTKTRGMTIEALGWDCAPEMNGSVFVSRAVDPLL